MILSIVKSYIPDLFFWIICTIYRNIIKKDIKWLSRNYFKNINGWKIGHFLSYLYKGVYFKIENFLNFITIGFIFEIVEYLIETKTNIEYVDSSIINDTIINSCGYITGSLLFILLKNNSKK